MKMKACAALLLVALVLAGCSSAMKDNGAGTYAKEASEYMDKVAQFASEIPKKAEEAANDEQAKQELKDSLEEMRQEINEFGKVQAPEIAEDFHREIVDKSKLLEEKIDVYQERIDQGDFNKDFVKKEDFSNVTDEIKASFEKLKDTMKRSN